MAKGIRISQLAKELSVSSKAIIEKLKAEGLENAARGPQSTVPLGLAESVREWFSAGHGGGTAVETAAPVAVEEVAKPKAKTTRRRKKTDAEEEEPSAETQVAETQVPQTQVPETPQVAHPVEEPAPETEPSIPSIEPPVTPAAPVVEQPVVQEPAAASDLEEPTAPPVPPVPQAEPVRPAAEAPESTEAQARSGRQGSDRPALRETITLANRPGLQQPQSPARKPITPAPQLRAPLPAQMQGPKLIREEKPDHVPVPGPRGPRRPPAEPPAFTTARPSTGRGVKSGVDDEEEVRSTAGKGKSLSARRRGTDGRRGEAMEKLREFTEADLIERRDRLAAAAASRQAFDSHLRKSESRGTHARAQTGQQRGKVSIESPITVKSLSAAIGVKANEIISKLMRQGIFATINQSLDQDVAEAIALEFGVELTIAQQASEEQLLLEEFQKREAATPSEKLVPRPPVVTILGHVDHGKTSLLDKIRSANVAAGEAGGITQHTAAWMVSLDKGQGLKRVTFIDTPGHQAFTSMRARGADMTDVVVLVVSAAEGVQPQTIESINHARAAKKPIVVAMNKIDRPDANDQKVLGELAAQGLNPVEWGGDTEVVRTSAITGQGIDELLEILHYQSELLELKADPSAPARGTVIEARIDEGLGPVATVLVQNGTLKVGDVILSGTAYGRVRGLFDDNRRPITQAGPSTPVIVSGLSELPGAGDRFYSLGSDFERARTIAEERAEARRRRELAGRNTVTAANLLEQMKEGQVKTINLIIKADVLGSVETLVKTVTDYNTDEVKIRVIHSAVGGITESDVELAAATKDVNESTVIIGFHVVPDEAARALAEQLHVEIRTYRVIYEIFDDLKKALSGLLEPEIREKLHGHLEVRQVFRVSRLGNIAGCLVTDGHVQRGSRIRLIRDGRVVTEDLVIESLKRLKDDVREVKSGLECGIKLAGYDDIKVGDRFEAYIRETFQRTL